MVRVLVVMRAFTEISTNFVALFAVAHEHLRKIDAERATPIRIQIIVRAFAHTRGRAIGETQHGIARAHIVVDRDAIERRVDGGAQCLVERRAPIRASVVTMQIMVAMSGAIMREPLQSLPNRTVPISTALRLQVLRHRVRRQIASAASPLPEGAILAGIHSRHYVCGPRSGTPITPVLQMHTCSVAMPRPSATQPAVVQTSSAPRSPSPRWRCRC